MNALTTIVGMKNILYKTLANSLTLKLYSNNKTPALGDDIADYTEVSGGGYSEIIISSSLINNWVFNNSVPVTTIYNDFLTFNFSSTTTIGLVYGYYLISKSDNISLPVSLLCAQRFDQVFVPNANRFISIKPHLAINNL